MPQALMRAVKIRTPGDPEVLEPTEVPVPSVGPGEVLVRVRASGVNRADLLQRRGLYPPMPGNPPEIPGLEFAGSIEALGDCVTGWAVGDRVMGIVGGGGYAEFVRVDARLLIPIPEGWSFEVAAAVPEAYLTAHDAMAQTAAAAGTNLLVHAVGSSVGVALLALGRRVGCRVAGTSRTQAKLDRALALGLDRAMLVGDRFEPDEALESWADVICDLVGAPYLAGNVRAARPQARIIVIGLTGGRIGEVDLGAVLRKRLRILGTVLRTRSTSEKAALVASFRGAVWPALAEGALTPVLDRAFPVREAAKAHQYLEENRNFGSVVLVWD